MLQPYATPLEKLWFYAFRLFCIGVLVFLILGALWWAIHRGQFEDVEREGTRILNDD